MDVESGATALGHQVLRTSKHLLTSRTRDSMCGNKQVPNPPPTPSQHQNQVLAQQYQQQQRHRKPQVARPAMLPALPAHSGPTPAAGAATPHPRPGEQTPHNYT